MSVASSWLTAQRVRRIVPALSAFPHRLPGLQPPYARMRLWRACGGPIEDIGPLIDVILHAGLIKQEQGTLRLTDSGRRALIRHRRDGHRPVALALLRSGLLHDQARRFLESFPTDSDGAITCRASHARNVAPQLLGLLEHWPALRGHDLTVPKDLVRELGAVWALLSPPPADRALADARRWSIGKRAELYSYQFERLKVDQPSAVIWVAEDDETLGYDIEDRTTRPRRRIEVKGSGGPRIRFFLSENEWGKAHDDPTSYEIQFWGGIDLNRPVAEEYESLRRQGYPLVFADFPALLASGVLEAVPDRWKVIHPGRPTG